MKKIKFLQRRELLHQQMERLAEKSKDNKAFPLVGTSYIELMIKIDKHLSIAHPICGAILCGIAAYCLKRILIQLKKLFRR